MLTRHWGRAATLVALTMATLHTTSRPATAADAAPGDISWHAEGASGAVAAGGAEAVAAGIGTLGAGGNAADAAAATILALSVTDSTLFCFGGEVPIIVYDAQRDVVEVIAGQGVAPRLATREFFASRGGIPTSGLLAAAVPAALDACITLLDRHGTLTFAQAAAPALAILDRHAEPWHADLARTIRRLIDAERSAGTDRRRGLRAAADYFYRGPIAHELADWCEANGGLIRYSDLATHVTRIEEPASTDYRGFTVHKCGVWTQGPYLLQTPRLLEGFDLASLGHNRPETIHLTVEAMKLALADRDTYYADPLFADVPTAALLSREYADVRRPLIDRQHASQVQRAGDPRGMLPLGSLDRHALGLAGTPRDTTTCLVADRAGNVIAATPSGWSGVLAGPTGIWLGSRLQSFNTWEDSPNVIEPGKRPRITLTPTLVMRDGKPVLAVSVAGGDGQDQASIQMVLDAIDFGLSPAESVSAVRFGTNHHVGSFGQTPPQLGSLLIYPTAGDQTIAALKAKGHHVSTSGPPLWAPCVLAIDPASGHKQAAGDAAAGRHAAAH